MRSSGRIGAIALVGRIDLLAEGVFGLIEDDGEMGRLDPRRAVAHELKELGAKQPHRSGRQPVGAVIIFRILADRLKIGAKNEGGPVDQENMISGADWVCNRGHRFNRSHRPDAIMSAEQC